MGTLRLLLALAVVYGHTEKFFGVQGIPGYTAVQIFYAISGFYMALVLSEKYKPGATSTFLLSRFLRLFPTYAIVAIATICMGLIANYAIGAEFPFQQAWRKFFDLDWSARIFLVTTQLMLAGQDLCMFLGLDGQSLVFYPFVNSGPDPLIRFLPIPQSWTLGVECSFYHLAPFIVRRSVVFIAGAIFVSLAIRIMLATYGFSSDPWSYRFF